MKDRKLIGMRGCTIRGSTDIGDFSHCGDKTCPSCNMMAKALVDEVNRQLKKLYNEK